MALSVYIMALSVYIMALAAYIISLYIIALYIIIALNIIAVYIIVVWLLVLPDIEETTLSILHSQPSQSILTFISTVCTHNQSELSH